MRVRSRSKAALGVSLFRFNLDAPTLQQRAPGRTEREGVERLQTRRVAQPHRSNPGIGLELGHATRRLGAACLIALAAIGCGDKLRLAANGGAGAVIGTGYAGTAPGSVGAGTGAAPGTVGVGTGAAGAVVAGGGVAGSAVVMAGSGSAGIAGAAPIIGGAGSSGSGALDASVADAAINDPSSDSGTVEPAEVDAGTMPGLPPFETNGAPLSGSKGTWTYIEFPESQCRDGSAAGVYVNLGSTNKLMIFLEGGGRCADADTCAAFPANVNDGSLIRGAASAGVLDRSKTENPVRDWNIVYVPYCTGDRHGGANPDGNVPGLGPQKFVGYLNMKKFLNRIVPTFREASDVLLTGISAGGFGVAYNSVLVQRAFPKVKLKIIIDSGPFVSNAVFSACDQERTRTMYKAEQTFLGDCGAACPNQNDYWMDFGVFLAKTFSDRPSGLISSTEDAVERAFFGLGNDNCTAALDLLNPGVPAATFRSDVLAYRKKIESFPNSGTFYLASDTHTFIAFDAFDTTSAGGVRLVDWFAKIVNGQSPGQVGP